MYLLFKLIYNSDLSYRVKHGKVVDKSGKDSGRFIDDIEMICKIHKVSKGYLFCKWEEDHYRIKTIGEIKKAKTPLNNSIC